MATRSDDPKLKGKGREAEDDDNDDDEEDLDDDDDNEQGKGDDDEFDEARARKTIENQRKAEKELKRKLSAANKRVKDLEGKDLPDAEKQKQELQEAKDVAAKAQAKVRKANLRSEAMEQAAKLKFKSPAVAARLIDLDDVEWDEEEDEPTNVKQLLKDLLDEEPWLKGRAARRDDDDETDEDETDDEGAGRGRRRSTGGSKSGNDFINRSIRRQAGRG